MRSFRLAGVLFALMGCDDGTAQDAERADAQTRRLDAALVSDALLAADAASQDMTPDAAVRDAQKGVADGPLPDAAADAAPIDIDAAAVMPDAMATPDAQPPVECDDEGSEGAPCIAADQAACSDEFACQAGVCRAVLPACDEERHVVFVHGINGEPANFDVLIARLIEDGWPAESLHTFAAADASWGCNIDNAAAIAELVQTIIDETCQPRIDLVAHSMGTLSSRYFVKNLGGLHQVNTYLTLGGMHHGLLSPCFAPEFLGVCVWQELCLSGEYLGQLNADPATPGELNWVSIYGTADATVPNDSSHLEGAENILIEGAEHDGENGLLQRMDAYEEVKRVLHYPCW